MKLNKYIALAALTMPLAAAAQTTIDFEKADSASAVKGYHAVGVYDLWENSPFRTGKLKGNVKVVSNPYKETNDNGSEINSSDHVLAFQRSRFAGNAFGVRVDLVSPVALSPTTKYVHAKIHTPKSGRVMLFGLGKRTDWTDQDSTVVQVEVKSSSTVKADGHWYDAVFPVSAAKGVQLHSLVIAPDVESTHDLDEDFAVYVDDIEISTSSSPRFFNGVYPICAEKTQTLSRSDRYGTSVSLTSSDGAQTLSLNQQTDKLLYQDLLAQSFLAKAGDTVTPNIGYNGTWMSAYVYLDQNSSGNFEYNLNEDGTPGDNSDVMTYSYYNGKNSSGESVSSGNTRALTKFTIPSTLTPGYYRMRFKIDWNCIDPAGNTSDTDPIIGNGGVIVDTRLNVHGDEVSVSRGLSAGGTNGEVLKEDGTTLDGVKTAFGKPYTVKFKAGDGFKLSRFTIRHGYNLSGDSLVNETPQYLDVTIPAYMVVDGLYTIPAKYMDGDVMITPEYVTIKETEKGDYALNFDKTLAHNRSDRRLKSIKISTTSHTSLESLYITAPTTVYQDYTKHHLYAKGGDNVNINVDYANANRQYMHAYLYMDLDRDGYFSTNVNADGTPAWDGEMLSFNYNNGYNSLGDTKEVNASSCFAATNSMPQFTVPEGLPVGDYRVRFKLDWNDDDPAGRYGKGSNDINNNGGYVVDFTLTVVDEYPEAVKLDVQTENGSLVGYNNSGVPETVEPQQYIPLLLAGPADGYTASSVTVRTGKNLDGESVVDGETQWTEETVVPTDGVVVIPADDVKSGTVRVSAVFDSNSSEYTQVFGDEFDLEDGSMPNVSFWSRSGWATPAWKRFTAQTKAGQEETGYIEDGKMVLRCLKNTHSDEVNKNTNAKLDMISGAIETAGKVYFTYGKVEARLKTTAHTGNFPAFWMMPNSSEYGGWPYSGEIDIFEQINNEDKSYHTIHSKWANSTSDGSECQGQSSNPQKTANEATVTGEYHVYGLEWTEDILKWYVDGKQVFSYAKSTTQDDLDKGQWPFDKPFYIILNQSVGNGSWASNPDTGFTYETKVDWVRVYQKGDKNIVTGLKNAGKADGISYTADKGSLRITAGKAAHVSITDVQGRTLFSQNVEGSKTVHLSTGVYLVNGNKVIVP